MNKLKVSMKHCYGIQNLNHAFDFSKCKKGESRATCIYASNGSMKTSFTKSFDDFSKKGTPEDRVYSFIR